MSKAKALKLEEDAYARAFGHYYVSSWYWSFQVCTVPHSLLELIIGGGYLLRFLEYWNPAPHRYYPFHLEMYRDWFFVFACQIVVVAAGAIGILEQKVKGKPLPLVISTVGSIVSLILGCFQWLRQLEWGGSMFNDITQFSVSLDIGFHLALTSVILWLVSGWLHFHLTDSQSEDERAYLPSVEKLDVETQTKYPRDLFARYAEQYPHNPEGVLEWHIRKKMKEGRTREQALEELAKESK